MPIGAYLYFNGTCREAVDFYSDAFKTDAPKLLTYGESPGGGGSELTDDMKKLILHAELTIAGDAVMLSDAPPDRPVTAGNSVSLMASLETVDKVCAVFDMLKAGGQVIMEAQETFFSKCYAYVIDRFGVSWQLNVDARKD